MADRPTLQIDDDWKRQAQEEKRRLAEQEKARAEAAAAAASAKPAAGAAGSAAAAGDRRSARDIPAASFTSLVQSMLTQADYYLGSYAGQDGEPMVDLDGAKFQLDLLTVVEEKTKGNLDGSEQSILDAALYELRSRYVSIATQMIR
jgi:hypothetical protein